MASTAALQLKVAPWVERLARLGYISKGTVYLILGLLAAAAGAGLGGETGDRRETLHFILRQPFSRFGMAARGVLFGGIGGSLVRAAFRHDSRAAKGTSGALRTIASQPFGRWLLVIIGVGLAAYGVYSYANARYRVIRAA